MRIQPVEFLVHVQALGNQRQFLFQAAGVGVNWDIGQSTQQLVAPPRYLGPAGAHQLDLDPHGVAALPQQLGGALAFPVPE